MSYSITGDPTLTLLILWLPLHEVIITINVLDALGGHRKVLQTGFDDHNEVHRRCLIRQTQEDSTDIS